MKQIEREAIALMKKGCYNDAAVLLASIKKTKATDGNQVASHLLQYGVSNVEHFLVITLDTQCQIIGIHEIAKGGANQVNVHVREVFRPAFIDNATGIILAHNHPAGTLNPSKQDVALTRQMMKAGDILKIPVLDHLILVNDKFASITEIMHAKKSVEIA
jgi:DNA repair protein RadC